MRAALNWVATVVMRFVMGLTIIAAVVACIGTMFGALGALGGVVGVALGLPFPKTALDFMASAFVSFVAALALGGVYTIGKEALS